MSTTLTLDVTSILEMALLALLVAVALPFGRAPTAQRQAGLGLLRGGIGCLVGAGAWLGAQLAGQALEPRIAPKWAQVPMVSIPVPPPMAPPPATSPGSRDI